MKSCNCKMCKKKKREIFIITEATRDTIIWSDGASTSDVENIWNVINIEKQKKKKKKKKTFHQLFCNILQQKYFTKPNKYVKSSVSKYTRKKERQKNHYIITRKARLYLYNQRLMWKISATLMRGKKKHFDFSSAMVYQINEIERLISNV